MKKILTSLLANFAVVTSAAPLMANQVTSQEIENMRTKVDLWIEKTRNWRNYIAEEFSFTHYNTPGHFFSRNMLDTNERLGYYEPIEFLDNYTHNPYQPVNERKWFDCKFTYFPYKVVDLKCNVRSSTYGSFITEFPMNDYVITKPENMKYSAKTIEHNKIIVRTLLNNGNLDMEVCFLYPTGVDRVDEESYNRAHHYNITSNHSASNKINIIITGTIIYKIRETAIQELHNKLLSIKEQLNNPNLQQDAYKNYFSFMNLEK